jgi:hypothetical protein
LNKIKPFSGLDALKAKSLLGGYPKKSEFKNFKYAGH